MTYAIYFNDTGPWIYTVPCWEDLIGALVSRFNLRDVSIVGDRVHREIHASNHTPIQVYDANDASDLALLDSIGW